MFPVLSIIDYIFLPIVAVVVWQTSQSDIRATKIPNKWILFGIRFGLMGFVALWAYSAINFEQSFDYIYFGKVIVNTLIAFGLGYMMWYWDLWAAGDAKLFAVLTFLLPLKYYDMGYLPIFPASAFLINIFVVILVYLGLLSLYSMSFDIRRFFQLWFTNKLDFKKIFTHYKNTISESGKTWWQAFWVALVAFLVIRLVGEYLVFLLPNSIPYLSFLMLLLLLLSYQVIDKILMHRWWVVYIGGVGLLGYYVYAIKVAHTLTRADVQHVIIFTLLFLLLYKYGRMFLAWYNEKTEVRIVPVAQLEAFMILHPEEITAIRQKSKFFRGQIFYPDGIQPDQLQGIKDLCFDCNVASLRVYKTFAFAPWIGLGLVATILLQASFVHVILAVL